MTFWSNTGEALQRQPDNYYGLQVSKLSLRYVECESNSSSFLHALHMNTHNLFVANLALPHDMCNDCEDI